MPGIEYVDFLKKIIDDGIKSAAARYPEGSEELRSAVAGFTSCEGLDPADLRRLLIRSRADATATGKREESGAVGWVCDCVSVLLESHKLPMITRPGMRAHFKVAEVLGVSAGAN